MRTGTTERFVAVDLLLLNILEDIMGHKVVNVMGLSRF